MPALVKKKEKWRSYLSMYICAVLVDAKNFKKYCFFKAQKQKNGRIQ
jgi:hypothetical protein